MPLCSFGKSMVFGVSVMGILWERLTMSAPMLSPSYGAQKMPYWESGSASPQLIVVWDPLFLGYQKQLLGCVSSF